MKALMLWLVISQSVAASSLTVHYGGGWGPGYQLVMDFESKKITLEQVSRVKVDNRIKEELQRFESELRNSDHLNGYFSELLTRIDRSLEVKNHSPPDDEPSYWIEYKSGDINLAFRLEPTDVPTSILLEGQTRERELQKLDSFRKEAERFVFLQILEELREALLKQGASGEGSDDERKVGE